MSDMDTVERLAYEAGRSAGQMNAFFSAFNNLPDNKQQAFLTSNTKRMKRLCEMARLHHEKVSSELATLNDLVTWAKHPSPSLEACNTSHWHKVLTAHTNGSIYYGAASADRQSAAERIAFRDVPQVVLIQHNWAAAFSGAQDFEDGEVKPPFDCVVFEMAVAGRRVVHVKHNDEQCDFIQAGDAWVYIGPPQRDTDNEERECSQVCNLVSSNIRAACIALDAAVAVTSVTRAPYRLNIAREKKGLPPIFDFHTVSLANRSRVDRLATGDAAHRSPRLHFRRGHWRHYSSHKS